MSFSGRVEKARNMTSKDDKKQQKEGKHYAATKNRRLDFVWQLL